MWHKETRCRRETWKLCNHSTSPWAPVHVPELQADSKPVEGKVLHLSLLVKICHLQRVCESAVIRLPLGAAVDELVAYCVH